MNGTLIILQGTKKKTVYTDEVQADSVALEAIFDVAADYNDEAQADSLALEAIFDVANDYNVGIAAAVSSCTQARNSGPVTRTATAPTIAAPYTNNWYIKSISGLTGTTLGALTIGTNPQTYVLTTLLNGSASAILQFGVKNPVGVETLSSAALNITIT